MATGFPKTPMLATPRIFDVIGPTSMSRRAPAKIRNMADTAKIVFAVSLLLAFGLRRGFEETRGFMHWLGAALIALIAVSGAFALVAALTGRRRDAEEDGE